MPYANEHACRLLNPVKGAPTKRVNGQRKHNGKAYDVIFQKQNGTWKEQAYRYPTKTWTESAARSHCKSHKGIRFEPSAKKEKQTLPSVDGIFASPGDNPYVFTMPGVVEFAGKEEEAKRNLRLTLYDGSVVKHWYWGFLAFEQKTMRMAKRHNPILFNHDVAQRVAVSDNAVFEPKFVMEGRFLGSSGIAEEIQNQMAEGFPFESSLRFDPNHSDIEMIKEGQSVEVNGHKLKGPGTVIRNALILEGSVCVFGALKNTKSQAFEQYPFFKEPIMPEETASPMTVAELTAENFAEILPDLYARITAAAKAEAESALKARFDNLQKICGPDTELLAKCFAEGKTPAEASTLRMSKLEAANKQLTEKLSQATLAKPSVDPAVDEFNAQAPEPGSTEQFDEAKATEQQLKDHYAQTQDLQDEFHSVEAYVAYVTREVRKGERS